MASDLERRATLEAEAARRLAHGGRLESKSDYTAVVLGGSRVDHTLHLIQRTVIEIDESGVVHTSDTKQRRG
jgi:hypothetical protein